MKIVSMKPVEGVEEKPIQQREAELLAKHEQEEAARLAAIEEEKAKREQEAKKETPVELKEEDVLKFIGAKYNKQVASLDDLFKEPAAPEELPEDVSVFLKFKKETGRGLNDFMKFQRDYDSVDDESILREYFKETEPDLDDNEIDTMLDDYRYNEDVDEESTVNKIKIDRKKAVKKAKNYFNEQKSKYKAPLESSVAAMSEEEKMNFEAYKQSLTQSKSFEEEGRKKGEFFMKKTEELFNPEFKGFEFDVSGKKVTFSPGTADELKKNQSSPMNFISKYLGEDGFMKDASGYHKALSIAMNPEKFANFFYEQGKADATDDLMKKTKNINMKEGVARVELKSVNGLQVKPVEGGGGLSSGGLVVKSI